MKDLAGIELQEGDLLLDIRTDWAQCRVCRAVGGQTATGKVRFVMWAGHKGNSHEKCVLKITPQHAREVLESTRRVYIERHGENTWNFHYEKEFQNFLKQIEE